MTRLALPLLAIAGAASGASAGPGDDMVTRTLAGLTAKPATDCIRAYPARAIGGAGQRILFRVSDRFYYVNDAGPGCERVGAGAGDIFVVSSVSGRTCDGDIGSTVTPTTGTPSGTCRLGRLTEYRK